MVGLMRFVAYLCDVNESDVNDLNSPSSPSSPNHPNTGIVRMLVYYSCISLRDREHARDTLIPTNN